MNRWRLCLIAALLLPTVSSAADSEPLQLDLPQDVPTVADDGTTVLPPIIVTPPETDFWYFLDRHLHRLRGQLPALGTDLPRRKERSERVLEALGLRGEGVQALHPSKQQDLVNFVEKLEGQ